MPKGERVLAQSKRTAPPPIFKILSGIFQNWNNDFQLVVEGRFSKLVSTKTLLMTKRRISFRGSFVVVKGKAFETGGENFKS